jgi:D-glycero-D-manno-heptose 1,7-bisphosphate phosphatase
LRAAKQKGYLIIVITNQPDVSRGLLDPEDLRAMHTLLMKELPIDHIELCTSSDDTDFRRKPNPGMILDAANKLNVDLAASFLVGDGEKDIMAGKRAGIKTILLKTPYNSQIHGIGDFNCSSLDEVRKLL